MDGKNLSVNLGILGLIVIGILMLSVSVNAGCVAVDTDYKCGATITKSCVMNESLTTTGKGPCFIIGADNVVIDGNGHSIIGNSSLGDMPIDPMSGSINQNTLQDLSYGISAIDFSKINDLSYLGSIVGGRKNVIIKNLTIRNFDIGILYYGSNSKVVNNAINNNSLAGIALIGSNNLIANNTINNTLLGNGLLSFSYFLSYFLLSFESDNNNVTNNTLENTLLGIGLLSLKKNGVKNNIIKDNFIKKNGIGIGLLSSTNNVISNNIINQTLIGIAANDSTNNNIINNAANNGLIGIALNSSTNNYIAYNNITYNHMYSLFDFGDKGCNNVINNTGGDGKPIKYINNSIGVTVKNTDNYSELIFCRVNNSLIDNVTITNPQTESDGIVFVYSNNNTINNSNLNNDFIGIALSSSDNNNVSNNTANNNTAGIGILSSVNNLVANNEVNNNRVGIGLFSSINNIITNNTANNGLIGTGLVSSTNNYIAYNNLTNNRIYSLFDAGDKGCNNVINNTGGDGKPIKYINDSIGVNVKNKNNYSELIFCRVNNSLIDNVTITNPKTESDGIVLVYSNNNTIKNSNLNNNFIGIALSSSNNNNIIHNTAKNNTFSGIALIFSNNSNINTNTVNGGIFKNALINSSLINTFINIINNIPNKNMANNIINAINAKGVSGIYLDPAFITLVNSITNHRTFMGIALISSNYNNISNNTANDNNYGISLSSSTNNTVLNNTANNNNVGIYSKNSTSTINNNYVCGNTELDFNSTDWLSSYGDNNTCNKSDGWHDKNLSEGCKYKCPKYEKCVACKEPKDVFDAVKMLEDLSSNGEKDSNNSLYCDLNNDGKIDLNDVFDLIDNIVVEG